MVTHHEDLYPDEYGELASGACTVLQVDRKTMFTAGDVVVIREVEYASGHSVISPTGRKLVVEVTHVKATWPESILSVRLAPAPGG